jgi:hypothetical protein
MKRQTYDQCGHYSYRSCTHIDDDVMRRANQDLQRFYGKLHMADEPPTNEEINKICDSCTEYTKK